MNEGFTSGLGSAIEMSAKVFEDVLGDFFAVVTHPVFEDSQNNDAEGAFVIEAVDWFVGAVTEVPVGAGGLEGFHF